MRQLDEKEFYLKAEERFGGLRTGWKFVCPECGTAQCADDFTAAGISQDDVKKLIGVVCLNSVIATPTCLCDLRTVKDQKVLDKCVELRRADGQIFNFFELAPESEVKKPNGKPAPVAAAAKPESKNSKQQKKETGKMNEGKKQTDEERKAAARERARKWREEHKTGTTAPASKPKTGKAPAKIAKLVAAFVPRTEPAAGQYVTAPVAPAVRAVASKSKNTELVLVFQDDPTGKPAVYPTIALKSEKDAWKYIELQLPPGTYRVARVSKARTLDVQHQEIRKLK